jgi:D-glycero-alpha-D-manno-heptose 1-phosphate guanylyltransferase
MQAIILAGGFGTRLQGVVSDVPKPMAPIGDKPFLALLISYLKRNGVREVVLSVHYMKEKIEEYFGDRFRGVSIKYAHEDEPLGTGGAIVNSLNILRPKNPVLVINGDTFLNIDIGALIRKHKDSESKITIALRKVNDCSRFGEVVFDGDVITDFAYAGGEGEGYINAGIYVMDPDIFDKFTLNHSFSFEKDFMYQHTSEVSPTAFLSDNYFIDIGIPEDYSRACEELPALIG